MPINANLLLGGQVADVTNPILRGISAGTQIRQAGMQDQLLRQNIEQNDLIAQQRQQEIDKAAKLQRDRQDAENSLKGLQFIAQDDYAGLEAFARQDAEADPQGAQGALQIAELAQRAQAGDAQAMDRLKMGFQGGVQRAQQMGVLPAQAATPAQFGASSLFKDSSDNVYSVTEKRNPNTGQVEQVYSAVTPGAPAEPVGDIRLISRSTGLSGIEAAELEGVKTKITSEAKATAERRQEAIRIGNVARDQVRSVRRMRQLLDKVKTGGIESIKKSVGDFFGFTPGDVAELNNKFGQIILTDIKKLGANPTEGERAFLEQISASFEQGNEANEAILSDMQNVLERQVERAQLLANNPDMTVQEAMIRQSEFIPSYDQSTDGQILQQPVQNQPAPSQSTTNLPPRRRSRSNVGDTFEVNGVTVKKVR